MLPAVAAGVLAQLHNHNYKLETDWDTDVVSIGLCATLITILTVVGMVVG